MALHHRIPNIYRSPTGAVEQPMIELNKLIADQLSILQPNDLENPTTASLNHILGCLAQHLFAILGIHQNLLSWHADC
ncbi:hypothetical protein ACVWXO_001152 [Bradyrhizobium sp. LM2.7]